MPQHPDSDPRLKDNRERMQDEAIIRALCYSDIFGFPMTLEEIVRFSPHSGLTVQKAAARLDGRDPLGKIVCRRDEFYYLAGREENCELRRKRESVSKKKLEIALRRLMPLQGIPFLRTAMITGALAAFNSPEGDDVDLLIISAPRRVWTTYFFLRIWRLFGHNPDICFNMFLSEGDLYLQDSNQNFFYAREILGGISILNDTRAFDRLLQENPWIFEYFPSYIPDDERLGLSIERSPRWRRRQNRLEKLLGGPVGDVLEFAARKAQFREMVKNTPGAAGRMSATRIKLHKSDNRPPILNRYEENIRVWLARYDDAATGRVRPRGSQRTARSSA